MYDLCVGTSGWIKWSTKRSVGQSLAEKISLPGGGILPLCIWVVNKSWQFSDFLLLNNLHIYGLSPLSYT